MAKVDDGLMTATEVEREYDTIPDVHKGIYLALDQIKAQIAWLEYVPEYEFSEAECERVRGAAKRLYCQLRRLTNKYID